MAKLSEYENFKEKELAFEMYNIDTSKDLQNALDRITDHPKFRRMIFRGMSEAKYKIFTSAQRKYITEELFRSGISLDDMMISLIDNAKQANENLLTRYFKAFNITLNDFLVLSFLQHYGAPSTLLDFTYNIYKGLFFCIDGLNYSPSDNEIDNYFSLYVINLDFSPDLCSLIDVLEDNCHKVDALIQKHKQNNPSAKIGTTHFEEMMTRFPFNEFKMWKLFYLPGAQSGSHIFRVSNIPKLISSLYVSNLNLIAQEGLFIHFGDDSSPLESYFINGTNKSNPTYKLPQILCLNIHKSLKEHIVEKYHTSRRINKNKMYPQEESIAKETYSEFKINI